MLIIKLVMNNKKKPHNWALNFKIFGKE